MDMDVYARMDIDGYREINTYVKIQMNRQRLMIQNISCISIDVQIDKYMFKDRY